MDICRGFGLAAAARAASLLLVCVVACRHETRTPARRAQPTVTRVPTVVARIPATPATPLGAIPPQAPTGILMVTTDLPCIVTLDGVEKGRLRRDSGDTLLVPPGSHLLAAVETDSQRSWARLIDVAERERTEVSIRFVPQMDEEATGFRPAMPAIDFVSIAAGEFWMGSDRPIKGQRHRVRISRAFEIGRFLVTQEQWKRVIRRNPTPWDLENNYEPVVNVSWEEAQAFLQRLNRLDPSRVYRLPTEAEWEYVCRAGRDREAELADEPVRRGHGVNPAGAGQKIANAWGVFDMRGAVSEWCQDWYDQEYYRRSPDVDPTGPATGSNKVFRGGSFAINAEGILPAERASFPPTVKTANIGFRVVREAVMRGPR